MKTFLPHLLAACLMVAFVTCGTVDAAGGSVSVRLKDGSRWRGEIDDRVEVTYMDNYIEMKMVGELVKARDMYLVINGDIAGRPRDKTIFRDDIIAMRSLEDDDYETKPKRSRTRGGRAYSSDDDDDSSAEHDDSLGVFVLPLEGPVGVSFRHQEIEEIGEHADKFGRGQIIVLLINSNGGSAYESQLIADEIFSIRKRHRVVAWIKKAISAGCQTAMACEEIYFMTEGSAGAVTTWDGQGTSISGQDLKDSMKALAEIAERSGYSKYIAHAMKTNSAMCSYTKDPETGEVTFYDDMSGEVVLSDDDSNLSFNSSNALDCGFSKGTADTHEDLAKLLDLPRWHEITEHGRKIAKKWQDLVDKAQKDIPRLLARQQYLSSSGDAAERLGTLIRIKQDLIRWLDRAPNAAERMLGPAEGAKDRLQREIADLRKQAAELKRRRRR